MLGDIVCSQLLVSHLLMTFSLHDYHYGLLPHGRYAVLMSGFEKQYEHIFSLCLPRHTINISRQRENMLILLLGITSQIYSKKVVIITDRKCHDHVSDQEMGVKQNVTKHVIGPPTVWVSPLIISVVYVSWFELRFNHECWWHSHDYACGGIKLSMSVTFSRLIQALACHYRHVVTHFHQQWVSAMSIKLPRICPLFSLVKISWCSWHFAAWMDHKKNEQRDLVAP